MRYSSLLEMWIKETLKNLSGFYNGRQVVSHDIFDPIAAQAGIVVVKHRWITTYHTICPGADSRQFKNGDHREVKGRGGGIAAYIVHKIIDGVYDETTNCFMAVKIDRYLEMIGMDEEIAEEHGCADLECPRERISREMERLGMVGMIEIPTPSPVVFLDDNLLGFEKERR